MCHSIQHQCWAYDTADAAVAAGSCVVCADWNCSGSSAIAWSGDYFGGSWEFGRADLANFLHRRCRLDCRLGKAVPSLERTLKRSFSLKLPSSTSSALS